MQKRKKKEKKRKEKKRKNSKLWLKLASSSS
jgi:hypothetical protein